MAKINKPFRQDQSEDISQSEAEPRLISTDQDIVHLKLERETGGPLRPAPISLQLRDFYKMSCGISSKTAMMPFDQPLRKTATSLLPNDSFVLREQITAEGSLMERLISKINGAVGPKDSLRATIETARRRWDQHKSVMAVREKIYTEYEGDGHRLAYNLVTQVGLC